MNVRKRKKNGTPKNVATSAAAASRRALTIGISGAVPGVDRMTLRRWIRTILRALEQTKVELSLALVTDQVIHDLNLRYRDTNTATDVLSFPLADAWLPYLLGEVILSVETATRQARRRGCPLPDELQRLLIHGILHLVGYDHEISPGEADRMRRKERALLATLRTSDAQRT